jgi:hypothetical protein
MAVDFTSIDVPGLRQYSAQRLANSWNHLVDQLRANESRFSSTEGPALTAMMLHIQGGLSLAGLRAAGNRTIPRSGKDLAQLVSNTSALCALLQLKRNENPGVPQFKKLLKIAHAVNVEVRTLAPTVPVSQLAR